MSSCARRDRLRAAEARATELLEAIERAQLVRAGQTERMVEDDIYTMAKERFGVEKH